MTEKLDQFLVFLENERKAPPNTIISYRRDISKLLNYLGERKFELENVDHTVLQEFLLTRHRRGLKKNTIYREIASIKIFFKFCKKKSWIRKDPAKIIEFPKYDKPIPSFMTEEEVEKFLPLPILALRDYAIIEILYATGINVSELTGIDIIDISLKNKAIWIRGRKKRFVFFGRKASESLKYYLKARPLLVEEGDKEKSLFLNHMGKRIASRAIERIVERYWLISGLAKKITPQSFRHSFASHIAGPGGKSLLCSGAFGT